jgi:transposase
MNNREKQEQARGLYVKSTYNQKEIASIVKVTPKTLSKWVKDGNWDEQRDSLQITRPQLLQEAYAQLKAINQRIQTDFAGVPNKELSDAKAVIRKEIEALSSQPIHRYIEVFEEYIDWLSKTHPVQLTDFATSSQEFIHQLSKRK